MGRIELTPEQDAVVSAVLDWWNDGCEPRTITIGGYAGTGKTTMVNEMTRRIDAIVREEKELDENDKRRPHAVATFTGKAASVLKSKGVPATTLHRLLYKPEVITRADGTVHFTGRFVPEPIPGHIYYVVIDEASMVSLDIYEELLGRGLPIIAVGDHGQLEPVGKDARLMSEPMHRLETVIRQGSESQILRFATQVRRGRPIDIEPDREVSLLDSRMGIDPTDYDVVLCGFNKTRMSLNHMARGRLGHALQPVPQPGEKMVCLLNGPAGANGEILTVRSCRPKGDCYITEFEERRFDKGGKKIHPEFKVDAETVAKGKTPEWLHEERVYFTFGYAITVHKSQGSEWGSVLVIDEQCDFWEPKRWRYTAATRARRRLDYVWPGAR